MKEDCLFCKIIKGDIPSAIIFKDEDVIAFLDIFPFAKGHTLVVPVKHYSNFLEFPNEKMSRYFTALKRLTIQVKSNLNAHGVNIVQNNFSAAGQLIDHLHFHIIPRWDNDGKSLIRQPKEQASLEHLQQVLKQIVG